MLPPATWYGGMEIARHQARNSGEGVSLYHRPHYLTGIYFIDNLRIKGKNRSRQNSNLGRKDGRCSTKHFAWRGNVSASVPPYQ